MFDIKAELKKIPHRPGVYIMHEGDLILYVGKAVDLHNRVRQYFQSPKNKSAKILQMVSRVEYFEYIVTDSEMEALILENNLIKKHKPPYNTLLKDDKQYPYIKVTVQEPFPRIYKTRKIYRDKARYFGPYTSVTAVNETMELMEKLWPLRDCTRNLPRDIGKDRPCLNYHIGKCCGPCTGKVSQEEYKVLVDQALELLSGHHQAVLKDLKEKMEKASADLKFEEAAVLRDRMKAVEFMSQAQKIEQAGSDEERDIVGVAIQDDTAMVQVFFVRGGKLTGREHFLMESAGYLSKGQITEAFIQQFYSGTAYIPRQILVQELPEDAALLEKFLSERRGSQVSVLQPQRGAKAKLTQLAGQNAELMLQQFGQRLKNEEKRTRGAVAQLQELLHFTEYPISRIEAYDISNTFGSLSVGSMVVFEDGKPRNSEYRKFRIETVEGANDYASLQEVLTRRFTHAITEMKELSASGKDPSMGSFTKLPDLILMDGGRGQVNIAEGVLTRLGLEIPVAGMVKDDKHRTRGLYYQNREVDFGKSRDAFLLVTRIQDEAHRFAITYHRSLRGKEEVRSVLESIPGIGPARRKQLLLKYGSLDAIKQASVEDLADTPSMNEKAAKEVYRFYHPKASEQ